MLIKYVLTLRWISHAEQIDQGVPAPCLLVSKHGCPPTKETPKNYRPPTPQIISLQFLSQ